MLYDLGLWPSVLEPCMSYFSEGLRLRVGGLSLRKFSAYRGDMLYDLGLRPSALSLAWFIIQKAYDLHGLFFRPIEFSNFI